MEKTFFSFFMSDVISKVSYGLLVTWAQPLKGSISFKFSIETRLESESFDNFINFLAFLLEMI